MEGKSGAPQRSRSADARDSRAFEQVEKRGLALPTVKGLCLLVEYPRFGGGIPARQPGSGEAKAYNATLIPSGAA